MRFSLEFVVSSPRRREFARRDLINGAATGAFASRSAAAG
jgi:hypothetical protein